MYRLSLLLDGSLPKIVYRDRGNVHIYSAKKQTLLYGKAMSAQAPCIGPSDRRYVVWREHD